MKRKTVKTKMAELVELLGSNGRGRTEAAKRLGVSLSYVYRLEHGKLKPGKFLFAAIVRLCEEIKAQNSSNK